MQEMAAAQQTPRAASVDPSESSVASRAGSMRPNQLPPSKPNPARANSMPADHLPSGPSLAAPGKPVQLLNGKGGQKVF